MNPRPENNSSTLPRDPTVTRVWWSVGAALLVLIGVLFWTEPSINSTSQAPPQPDAGSATKKTTSSPPESSNSDDESSDIFEPTIVNASPPPSPAPPGMVWIPGGEFSMGCLDPRESICGGPDAMPDARPIHRVYVDGFWMDETEVTNAQFRKFVDATNYVTVAEVPPKPEDVPGVPPEKLVAGSIIFTPTPGPVPLTDHLQWWRYEPGASWQHPEGPGSDLEGKENLPVIHLAYSDVEAYCNWAGTRLPTEAQWEFASRGGKTGELYTWGNDLNPNNKWMGNIFQGTFPVTDEHLDGYVGISPVKQFPPNSYGLYDMAGNVWEWCSDLYRPDYYQMLVDKGGVAKNPSGPLTSFDPAEPNTKKRVHRGGSFLCTDQYCTRYMLGSRGKGELLSGSNHTGFRCILTPQDALKSRPDR